MNLRKKANIDYSRLNEGQLTLPTIELDGSRLQDLFKIEVVSNTAPVIRDEVGVEPIKYVVGSNQPYPFANDQYQYNAEFDHLAKGKLFVATHPLLNELHVFANENIPANTILGYYLGEEKPVKEATGDSTYYFNLEKNGKTYKVIDGLKERNWTASVNDGQDANIAGDQETIDGKERIVYRTIKFIKEGDGAIIDYGHLYNHPGRRLNFHPKHGLISDISKFCQNKQFYMSEVYKFDEQTCKDLQLSHNQFLVPTIVIAMYNNDNNYLKKYLDNDFPIDLSIYACDEKGLSPTAIQEGLDVFLLACYFGRIDFIKKFLDKGIDVNCCMRWQGFSPLHLLIQGFLRGNISFDNLNDTAIKILDRTDHPSRYDIHKRTILHYALEAKSEAIVSKLLMLGSSKKEDIFHLMFECEGADRRKHKGFGTCVLNNQFDILEIMLSKVIDSKIFFSGDFINLVKNKRIFSDALLTKATYSQLKTLRGIISNPKYSKKFKNTGLLDRVDKALIDAAIKKSVPKKAEEIEKVQFSTESQPYEPTQETSTTSEANIPISQRRKKRIREEQIDESSEPPQSKQKIEETGTSHLIDDTDAVKALALAAEAGMLLVVKKLVNANVNSDLHYNGKTALHLAIEQGHIQVVETLLEKANPNILSNNQTPLFLAARLGQKEIVKLLLSKNAHQTLITDQISVFIAYVTTASLEIRNRMDVLLNNKFNPPSLAVSISPQEIAEVFGYKEVAELFKPSAPKSNMKLFDTTKQNNQTASTINVNGNTPEFTQRRIHVHLHLSKNGV